MPGALLMPAYPQQPTFPVDVRSGRRTKVRRVGGTGLQIDIEDGTLDDDVLAAMPGLTFKANLSNQPGQPRNVSLAEVKQALALDLIDNTPNAEKPISVAQVPLPPPTPIPTSPTFVNTDDLTPALRIRPTGSLQNVGLDGRSLAGGYAAMWNGALNTDVYTDQLNGYGNVFAANTLRLVDELDNGTSYGGPLDPRGQPSNGIHVGSVLYLEHRLTGATRTGVRETLNIRTIHLTPSAAWNVNRNAVAARTNILVRAPDGGIDGTGFTGANGAFFAQNIQATAHAGATNLLELAGFELNIGLLAGSSARIRYGASVVGLGVGQGREADAAFATGVFPSSAPFRDQILISDVNGGNPTDPGGSIMRASNPNGSLLKVNYIFDFLDLNNDGIFRCPNVDIRQNLLAFGSGQMRIVINGLPTSPAGLSAGNWWQDTTTNTIRFV